jgi:hypothetical protein
MFPNLCLIFGRVDTCSSDSMIGVVGLFVDREDAGGMFLRNACWLSRDYLTVPGDRTLHDHSCDNLEFYKSNINAPLMWSQLWTLSPVVFRWLLILDVGRRTIFKHHKK